MTTARPKRDEAREDRITIEIVVDAYNDQERALGWYCYLENTLQFPFQATCIVKHAVSPLKVKDKVEVIGMSDDAECQSEIFVTISWSNDILAVPLAQLKPVRGTHPATKQAVDDWHYWVNMGYRY